MTQPRPIISDPAFAAVISFDGVVREWDAAFGSFIGIMDGLDPGGDRCWDDPQAVARAVHGSAAGPTEIALDGLLRSLGVLDTRLLEAEGMLLATRATSELGASALRGAVRRYARRPYGCRAEEEIMLTRLAG